MPLHPRMCVLSRKTTQNEMKWTKTKQNKKQKIRTKKHERVLVACSTVAVLTVSFSTVTFCYVSHHPTPRTVAFSTTAFPQNDIFLLFFFLPFSIVAFFFDRSPFSTVAVLTSFFFNFVIFLQPLLLCFQSSHSYNRCLFDRCFSTTIYIHFLTFIFLFFCLFQSSLPLFSIVVAIFLTVAFFQLLVFQTFFQLFFNHMAALWPLQGRESPRGA